MDNNSTLVMIPVDKIYPHPDNPRKDLGDISEPIMRYFLEDVDVPG